MTVKLVNLHMLCVYVLYVTPNPWTMNTAR